MPLPYQPLVQVKVAERDKRDERDEGGKGAEEAERAERTDVPGKCCLLLPFPSLLWTHSAFFRKLPCALLLMLYFHVFQYHIWKKALCWYCVHSIESLSGRQGWLVGFDFHFHFLLFAVF